MQFLFSENETIIQPYNPRIKRGNLMKITFMGAGSSIFLKNVLGDSMMCEALKDLLKEDFAAAEARGKASGKIEGVIQLYHEEMGLAPQEIVVRIMSRFSLDEETAQKYVENTLGLQPV
jgi:hypothetical protein